MPPYFQSPKSKQPPDGLSYFLGGQSGTAPASPMNPTEPDPYAVQPSGATPSGQPKGTASQKTTDPQQTAQVAAAQVMAQSPQLAPQPQTASTSSPPEQASDSPGRSISRLTELFGGGEAGYGAATQAVQLFYQASGRNPSAAEVELIGRHVVEFYRTHNRPPTPEEYTQAVQQYAGGQAPGGGTPPADGGLGGGTSPAAGPSGVVAVNQQIGEDGQLRFTGSFGAFGQTGGGSMTGMNLFHEILAQSGLDMGRVVVEQGVGGKPGEFRITAPPEYQQAIVDALQQATQAVQATPELEYGENQAGMGLISGLEQALSDPALGGRYASVFSNAGLNVPSEAYTRDLVNYARAASRGESVPAYTGGPDAETFTRYYNALLNAGIDTPYQAQGGRGVLRGSGGTTLDPRYFASVRRFRGGGGRALSQALGGY
jgi:hypothetical protein